MRLRRPSACAALVLVANVSCFEHARAGDTDHAIRTTPVGLVPPNVPRMNFSTITNRARHRVSSPTHDAKTGASNVSPAKDARLPSYRNATHAAGRTTGRSHALKLNAPADPPPAAGHLQAPTESWSGIMSAGVMLFGLAACCTCCVAANSIFSWADVTSYGLQLGSFAILVAVQTTAVVLVKVTQTSGAYTFSPASCVALTELCKLALAGTLHVQHVKREGVALFDGVSAKIVAHYFGLAVCYTVSQVDRTIPKPA